MWFLEAAGAFAPRASWVDKRLEYGFGIATTSTVLSGPEYGGTLGWSSFDMLPHGQAPRSGATRATRRSSRGRHMGGWIGRRVEPAFGEGESGLEFDGTRRPPG